MLRKNVDDWLANQSLIQRTLHRQDKLLKELIPPALESEEIRALDVELDKLVENSISLETSIAKRLQNRGIMLENGEVLVVVDSYNESMLKTFKLMTEQDLKELEEI
jgi:hypothetical protein